MTLQIGMAAGVLLAALVLLLVSPSRVVPGIAALAAASELAMALGLVRVHVTNVPLGLVFPLGLALPGLLAWFRSTTKAAVSAAAVVAFVGVLQTAMYLTSH
ncbi:MAG: hypothetical protein QM704_10095 [Anaeromyxobacteraceae bacterium]